MAAYEQVASDNFNRADSADLGASWDSGYTGYNALKIVSNQVQAAVLAGSGCIERYNAATLSPNQYSQVTIATYTAGCGGGPSVRMATPATATFMTVDTSSGNLYRITKFVSGAATVLATSSITATSGDVVRLEAEARIYRLMVDGVLGIAVADSAISSGSAGDFVYASGSLPNVIHDDWSCGNITSVSFSEYPALRPAAFKPGLAR